MNTEQKNYLPPMVEIIEMEMEGSVMSASTGSLTRTQWGTTTGSTNQSYRGGASSSDLEDMINDILTIEK